MSCAAWALAGLFALSQPGMARAQAVAEVAPASPESLGRPASGRSAAPEVRANASRPLTRTLEATRVGPERPRLDGDLSDVAWSRAAVARDFLQISPEPGAPATQRTEVRVLYTDDELFVGARMLDSQPDSIVNRLSRRDEWVVADEFSVAIDSYLDRRTAFVFAVTAAGVQSDFLMYDDTRRDRSWDAVWEASTRKDGTGWTAELRIPLSQLRFSRPATRGDDMRWGINFERELARRDEISRWSPRPADGSRDVSAFGTLTGLSAVEPARHLELRPYVVGRTARVPGASADPFYRATDLSATAGGDIRFGITNNLTLNGTINPDFGQVEADPAVVNLTAFETFLPEKRPFFQEGADIFEFDLQSGGGREQLFYSRRIGRRPQGSAPSDSEFEAVPDATTILGAAKISGKTADGWSLGFLDAVTAREDARYQSGDGSQGSAAVEPATNYAVARAIKDLSRGESAIGGILTATHRGSSTSEALRLADAAYAGGLDFRHKFGDGRYRLSGFALHSHVRGTVESIERLQRSSTHYFQRADAPHVSLDSTRTSISGSAADLELAKIGGGHWRWALRANARTPGFDVNALGFQRRSDRAAASAFVEYDQYEPMGPFRRWELRASMGSAWSFGGERTETEVDLGGNFQLKNLWRGYGAFGFQAAALSPTALRGGPALRTPAAYSARLGLSTNSRRAVRIGLGAGLGREVGGTGQRLSLSPSVRFQASSRFQLSLSPSLSWRSSRWQYVSTRTSETRGHYVFGSIDQTTASLTARLDYTFSPRLSLQVYAQPFVSAGKYDDFKEVSNPRAREFDGRFRAFKPVEITRVGNIYEIDLDGDSESDFSFGNPDFNVKSFRSNVVLRWEYRPGSTFYFVWSQDRGSTTPDGSFELGRDMVGVFDLQPSNVFLVKMEHWLGF